MSGRVVRCSVIFESLMAANQYDIYKNMWRTECGDRILDSAEAILFAKALSSLLNEATMGTLDYYKFYIESFDNLTFGQRISVLAIIGNGLLREDVPLVRLTAILDGAVAAVFKHIENEIAYEIDEPESRTNWRELVVAARKEAGAQDVPAPTCVDADEWELEVEVLTDRILWDRDYEEGHIYMDHAPEKTQFLKQMAMIPDNYYTAIANDLTDKQAQATIKELKKLCDSILEPL